MKKPRLLAMALLLSVSASMSSCSTLHLWRWGFDNTSFIDEPATDFSAAFLKPSMTILGSPVTLAWDAVTLPAQIIFGVYPYGSRHMKPRETEDDRK